MPASRPARGQLTLRQGASLALTAGDVLGNGNLNLEAGSRITVDPGQSITLMGNGQITLDGTLQAHGGRISVLSGDVPSVGSSNLPLGTPNARSPRARASSASTTATSPR